MSNLYSKIAQMKRNSEPANMSYSQTHWINGEKCKANARPSESEKFAKFKFSRPQLTTRCLCRRHTTTRCSTSARVCSSPSPRASPARHSHRLAHKAPIRSVYSRPQDFLSTTSALTRRTTTPRRIPTGRRLNPRSGSETLPCSTMN